MLRHCWQNKMNVSAIKNKSEIQTLLKRWLKDNVTETVRKHSGCYACSRIVQLQQTHADLQHRLHRLHRLRAAHVVHLHALLILAVLVL